MIIKYKKNIKETLWLLSKTMSFYVHFCQKLAQKASYKQQNTAIRHKESHVTGRAEGMASELWNWVINALGGATEL